MNEQPNKTTEMSGDELRERLHELKDQHEAIEREMERIQARMEGDDAEGGEPLGAFDPSEELRNEIEEWRGKYQRALADYQNYQHRATKNETEARKQGVMRVCESLIPVLDNFELALQGDPSTLTVESVLSGIRVTRDELLRALGAHGVTIVDPNPGDEFSPMHHEAVMQQEHEEFAPGSVVASFQKGYALGDRTLRAAKVSVRPLDDSAPVAGTDESGEASEAERDDADV